MNASPPRTAVVFQSGGRTQATSLVSVAIVVLVVLLATAPLSDLPLATLGALLAYVGTRIIRVGDVRAIRTVERRCETSSVTPPRPASERAARIEKHGQIVRIPKALVHPSNRR